MDILSLDWGGRAGAIWDVAKMEPCCGDPCNPTDGLRCFVCWYCCAICSMSKLYAHSVGQDCAIVNHVLPSFFCGLCTAIALRHNIRVKNGVGPKAMDPSGLVGDLLMQLLCGPCSICQVLRSVDNDAWDWLGFVTTKQIKPMEEPFILLLESGGGEHQHIHHHDHQ